MEMKRVVCELASRLLIVTKRGVIHYYFTFGARPGLKRMLGIQRLHWVKCFCLDSNVLVWVRRRQGSDNVLDSDAFLDLETFVG